jgi:CheY-like chemotaxis protein
VFQQDGEAWSLRHGRQETIFIRTRKGIQMDAFLAAPGETTWRLPSSLPSSAPRTLLIADDDIASAHALRLVLTEAGFMIDLAHTGRDAVAVTRHRRPGAIIMDLSMPLGDGWEAAQTIRSFDSEVLLIAHSSFTALGELRRTQEAGFDASFVKPCRIARLIELIKVRFR